MLQVLYKIWYILESEREMARDKKVKLGRLVGFEPTVSETSEQLTDYTNSYNCQNGRLGNTDVQPCTSDLAHCFLSGRRHSISDYSILDRIAEGINSGAVVLERYRFPVDVPGREWNRVQRHVRGNANESIEHRKLKYMGHRWLSRMCGAKDARYEIEAPAGLADVGSHSLNIYVECGTTKPERLFAYLDGRSELLVLPYGCDASFGFRNGYLFSNAEAQIVDVRGLYGLLTHNAGGAGA